jgi:SEC-C motif-containing protein
MNCFCGQPKRYQDCCQPCHSGLGPAKTAEQLMRSRFSAYVLQLVPYIAETYYPAVQSADAIAEIAAFAGDAHFLALQVLAFGDSPAIDPGQFPVFPPAVNLSAVNDLLAAQPALSYVHFKVWFLIADKLHLLEEHSRFVRIDGHWRYVDGVLLPHPVLKIGRNDLCPCGSGKKFKACRPHWLNHQPAPASPPR